MIKKNIGIKKEFKQEKQKSYSFNVSRDSFVGETEKSVLLKVENGFVWLNKKGIYPSNYTNLVRIYLLTDKTYSIIGKNKEVLWELSGKELYDYIVNGITY